MLKMGAVFLFLWLLLCAAAGNTFKQSMSLLIKVGEVVGSQVIAYVG